MAFSPKSKTATGLPIREKKPLSDELDMGMKCFLRQTTCSQATLVLRNSLLTQEERNAQEPSTIISSSQNKLKNSEKLVGTYEKATFASFGNVRESTAQAFPIQLSKPSEIGSNNYRKFINELTCDVRKREAYFRSLSREEEKRRLKILNNCQGHQQPDKS